jgi:hypothetical protein
MNDALNQPIDEKDDDDVFELPKVPKAVPGYVIYSQVAIDLGQQYGLGPIRQTALNLAIAEALRKGELRSYDVGSGLPCPKGKPSVYVRPDDIRVWLENNGYPLKWNSGLPNATDLNRGRGTQKEWTDERIKKLIARRKELEAQGVVGWASQAAKEFGVSQRLARKIIREYNERTAKLEDPSKWEQNAVGVPR